MKYKVIGNFKFNQDYFEIGAIVEEALISSVVKELMEAGCLEPIPDDPIQEPVDSVTGQDEPEKPKKKRK